MKFGRLSIPLAALAAVVILGAFAAGLIVNAVLASEPDPGPPDFPRPGPGDKLTLEVVAEPQAPASTGIRSTSGAPPERGAVYTWEDGDATHRVVLQDDLVLKDNAYVSSADEVLVRGVANSIVQRGTDEYVISGPVFRSESGGGLMTLPGGVLVALDPEWTEQQVKDFFAQNGISTENTSELGFIENGFLVDTEPGFPSLELANELAANDGVEISSPNWWRQAQAK